MRYTSAITETKIKLNKIYDDREALSIANKIVFAITNKKYIDGIAQNYNLTELEISKLNEAIVLLNTGKPLQYVIGKTYWYKYELIVNENCLIPRTETEELLEWIISDNENTTNLKMLDIGTGSGCLAIGLADYFKLNKIFATDISIATLAIAKKNALFNNVNVAFYNHDILNNTCIAFKNNFDIIVSNPPYIEHHEKREMHKNVLDFEPHNALFVTDGDAMQFYKAIITFSKIKLNKGGKLYFETSAIHNKTVAELLKHHSFENIVQKKDMHGNWRMVSAMKC
jgi:release factor glutamine methyltransferase